MIKSRVQQNLSFFWISFNTVKTFYLRFFCFTFKYRDLKILFFTDYLFLVFKYAFIIKYITRLMLKLKLKKILLVRFIMSRLLFRVQNDFLFKFIIIAYSVLAILWKELLVLGTEGFFFFFVFVTEGIRIWSVFVEEFISRRKSISKHIFKVIT